VRTSDYHYNVIKFINSLEGLARPINNHKKPISIVVGEVEVYKKKEEKMNFKYLHVIISVLLMVSFSSVAYAEWNYGIGTGLKRMNAKGDQGINVNLASLGPVEFEVDLDPDDFDDLMKTAYGFGGYFTDKTWMIQYSFVNLELEDEASRTVGATTASAKIGFDITGGEITVGYPIHRSSALALGALVGARYTKHGLSSELTVGAQQRKRSIDNDWTDGLVGLTFRVPFAEKWAWNTRLDAGAGGSEGTYTGNTGVTWRFADSWSATLDAQYQAIDYENGNKGDSDWYIYDVDEFGWGVKFLYHW
jgi:hypothetical protein